MVIFKYKSFQSIIVQPITSYACALKFGKFFSFAPRQEYRNVENIINILEKIMIETHQKLVDEYTASEKKIDKSRTGVIIVEVLIVGIVVTMKAIQKTASLELNICATSLVLLLLSWHFWGFYPRRSEYANSASIVLKGVELEMANPFLGVSFFRNYLKDFNALGQIIRMAIFDIFLIYFFSVLYTQLIKSINPEVIVKLRSITPISTALINLFLGWAYYRAIRPLVHLKRSIPGMRNA